METLKLFEIKNDMKGLDYFLPENTMNEESDFYNSLPKKYIALVIGAQHETKKAPPAKIAEIIYKADFPVVILGGNNDIELADSILKLTSKKQNIFNYAGQLSLNQSARIVKDAELVVTHDTGLMHIAAAFKKKIFSIWGNTIPEFGMYPYLADPSSKIFEVKGLKCRPCSKIGYRECPKKHFKCMNDQNSDEIARSIKAAI